MRLWQINEAIFAAYPHYLAASGAPVMGSMPGISMHTELEMLARLGLSPREALAAATNNYALQFGWTELGQIAPGRRADILVVDGDPTEASGTCAASPRSSSMATCWTAMRSLIRRDKVHPRFQARFRAVRG